MLCSNSVTLIIGFNPSLLILNCKKQLSPIRGKPARYKSEVSRNLRSSREEASLLPSVKQQHLHQQMSQTAQPFDIETEMERSIMMHEAKFQEVSNKNMRDLSAYDCWDEAKSAQDWIELCAQS